MRIVPKSLLSLTVLTWITVTGCDTGDQRLAQLAQHELETQHQQNETIARQSGAVVQESHELAVAAKQLVSQDAIARQELIRRSMTCTANCTTSGPVSIDSVRPSKTSAGQLPTSASAIRSWVRRLSPPRCYWAASRRSYWRPMPCGKWDGSTANRLNSARFC